MLVQVRFIVASTKLLWRTFHAFMLSLAMAFYVVEEKRISDCISVIGDVSRVSHEIRRSESEKGETHKSRTKM